MMVSFFPAARWPRPVRLLAWSLLLGAGRGAGAQPTTTYAQLPTTATIAIPAAPVAYPTTGTVRYVDAANGRDTYSGQSRAGAWQTFEYALATAPAGSRVIFLAGTYRVAAKVNLAKSLTLQPDAGATVWVKGSAVVTGWARVGSSANWRVAWSQKFPTTAGDSRLVDASNPIAGNLDMVFLDDKPLRQVGRVVNTTPGSANYFYVSSTTAAGVPIPVGPGEFCLDYFTGELTLGDDPTGKTVEVTALRTGLEIKKHANSAVLIQGLGFAHFADQAVASGAADTRLEYNAFAWNALQGLVIYGRYNYTNSSGTPVSEVAGVNNTLKGNDFACNGLVGVSGGQVDGLRFEGNAVRFNNCERFATGWAAGGAKFTQSAGQTFRANTFVENWGYALWLDIGAQSPVVAANTLRNNYGGVFCEISNGILVAGNLAVGNGNGVFVANSTNVRIYNNTLIDNTKNVIVKESNRQPEAHELGKGASFTTINTVLKNNLFFNTSGTATNANLEAIPAKTTYAPVGNPYGIPAKTTAGSAEMFAPGGLDYNGYFSAAAPLIRWTPDGAYTSTGATQTVNNYAALAGAAGFRAAVPGLEAQGLHPAGGADPFFVNPAGGDFRLRAGSPAIGAGAALPADVAAALGWPAGGTVSLGAFPFGTAAAVRNERNLAAVALSPNPAQDAVTITWAAGASRPLSAEVLDAAGRRVAGAPLRPAAPAEARLPLAGLPAGLYLIRLVGSDGAASTQRLEISR